MKPAPKDIIAKLVGELSSLPDNPRVLVTVSHCYIELFVHLLATGKCKNSRRIEASNRDYPHSVKIVLLHEAGIITDRQSEVLHWFRKKRNEAAHQVAFSLLPADLTLFRGLSGYGNAMPLDDPMHFRELCIDIVLGFWNNHVEFFAPLFIPELFPQLPPDEHLEE